MSFADFSREKLRNTDGFGFVTGAVFGAVISCITMVITIWNHAVPPIVAAKMPDDCETSVSIIENFVSLNDSEMSHILNRIIRDRMLSNEMFSFAETSSLKGKRILEFELNKGYFEKGSRCLLSKGYETLPMENLDPLGQPHNPIFIKIIKPTTGKSK